MAGQDDSRTRVRNWWKRITSADIESYLAIYLDDRRQHNLVRSVVIGSVVWAAAYMLKVTVNWLTISTLAWLNESPSMLLIFVPLVIGAILTALIAGYHPTTIQYRDEEGVLHELQDVEGDGIERAIALYFSSEPSVEHTLQGEAGLEVRWKLPTFSLAWRKFAATLATLGSGGSGGLSASVSLIGESLAAGLFKPNPLVESATSRVSLLRRLANWWQARTPDGLQTAQLAGIAAAVSTLFGTPFTAAFFATEIMYRRRPLVEKLLYALVAALVAYFLTDIASQGNSGLFEAPFVYVPPVDGRYYAILIVMGVIIASISINYVRLHGYVQSRFARAFPAMLPRHIAGASILALVALSVVTLFSYFDLTSSGLAIVLGTGNMAINLALAGELTIYVALVGLVAKIVATVVTIGSGGSAGLLIPSLYFGTMVATAMADFLEYEPMVLIVPAMTASLVSIVNVPLAGIMLAVELFGSAYILPAIVVLIVCSVLTQSNQTYGAQRETYDSRYVMPGVSARQMAIPTAWIGKTLIELDMRRRFNLNVIGLVEMHGPDKAPQTRLGTSPTTPLDEGDVLVVLGRDEDLEKFASYLTSEHLAGSRPDYQEGD